LEGLALEVVGKFYIHLVNFPAIWYIVLRFGIPMYFNHFGMLYQEQSATWPFSSLGKFMKKYINFLNLFGYFSAEKVVLKISKMWFGQNIGRFFHKNIWLP
jgi:hypothetical protein